MGEECPWCMGHGAQFWEQVVFLQGTFPKGNGFPKICLRLPTPTKKAKPPPKSAAQSISLESGEHVQEFKVKWSRSKKFTPSRSRSRSRYIGSLLNASHAEFFHFMLQFLCLQVCVYGGSVGPPPGGGGGRHLATVPQGVVGDHLPWGGEGQGGGGYKC